MIWRMLTTLAYLTFVAAACRTVSSENSQPASTPDTPASALSQSAEFFTHIAYPRAEIDEKNCLDALALVPGVLATKPYEISDLDKKWLHSIILTIQPPFESAEAAIGRLTCIEDLSRVDP